MPVNLPHEIEPLTTADATEVEVNFTTLENFVDTKVIHRDGSNSMTGQLLLQAGNPVQDNHAATKSYVDALIPVGVILPWSANTAPAGPWRLCNGQELAAASFPILASVLGNSYGAPSVPGMVKLPNLQGRMIVARQAAGSTNNRFSAVGKNGGDWEMLVPQHHHPMPHTHEHGHVHTLSAHTHEHPHTHGIDHNHASATTSTSTEHAHPGKVIKTLSDTGALGPNIVVHTATTGAADSGAIMDAAGAHSHTLDLPVTTGLVSEAVSEATTGGPSTPNTSQPGNAITDQPNNSDTSNTGVNGAEHLPPYIVLSYIIKVDA